MNYAEKKRGDLILPQGTFVFIQDGATGQVHVAVGPYKESLGEIDKLVIYDEESRKFVEVPDLETAIQVCPTADEGQYIILINPADQNAKEPEHPIMKKQASVQLKIGSKINIPGPNNFALYPGQIGKVLDGHNLKYNEYLIIRVYNEEQAKKNLENTIVKLNEEDTGKEDGKESTKEGKKSKLLFSKDDLVTGKLLVIKGTDVSFYIPPTGIEVVSDKGAYVRKAVTLERLEYCILLDQNGDKRYVIGPAVVFPKPTEEFLEQDGKKKHKAIELNENMGIYLKVIADYEEGGKKYKTGEELFVTGKEQKIYFPREEHAVVKYDDRMLHYAVAITDGEARYVLDKVSGKVKLVKGPNMYLPDPRTEVIVKRILDTKTINLWFPGNTEAIQHNQILQEELNEKAGRGEGDSNYYISDRTLLKAKSTVTAASFADEMTRKTQFTKPRTLTLDSKYEGAVMINIWPGYAIQKVKKSGERTVITGPKIVLLEYDETLEILELSTGKPKTDHDLMRTVYLQTENNIVSDIVDAETKDLVNVQIRLSYRVNFTGDQKKWFNVSNYVKLLTQNLRSIIRNRIKKENIEEFNDKAADIIRDIVIGCADEKTGKRPMRTFEENGMCVYDVEVLNVHIGDQKIEQFLKDFQKDVVYKNLEMKKLEKELSFTEKSEEIKRKRLEETRKTEDLQNKIMIDRIKENNEQEILKTQGDIDNRKLIDTLENMVLEIQKLKDAHKIDVEDKETKIRTEEYKAQMEAIQPRLIEAIISASGVQTTKILAENLKSQNVDWTSIFSKGGFGGLIDTIKGTPLYDNLTNVIKEYQDLAKK